jgi:hypothetical protein
MFLTQPALKFIVLTAFLGFFLGVFLAPVIRPLVRPFFVEIVKLVMSAIDEGKRATVQVKEEVDDVLAQAQHDAQKKAAQAAPATVKPDATTSVAAELTPK